MAKTAHDDVLDGLLNIIKNNGTRLCVCSSQPTTYTEAITTYKLAIKTISGSDYTGPADDAASPYGRKVTVNQEATITIDASATANYIALADSVNSKLLFVTTCTAQALTAGGTVTVPAWKVQAGDPT